MAYLGIYIGTQSLKAEAVSALCEQPLIDGRMLVETHAFPGGLFHIGNPGRYRTLLAALEPMY